MEILIVASDKFVRRNHDRLAVFADTHPGSRIMTCRYCSHGVAGHRYDLIILAEPPRREVEQVWCMEILEYRLCEHGMILEAWV